MPEKTLTRRLPIPPPMQGAAGKMQRNRVKKRKFGANEMHALTQSEKK
jgi:hypothetical protein